MELIKLSVLRNFLNVTMSTLYRWQSEGKIDFIKEGRRNYITRETFNKFVEESGRCKAVIYIFKYFASPIDINSIMSTTLEYCKQKKYTVVTTFLNILEINDTSDLNIILENSSLNRIVIYGDKEHPHIKELTESITNNGIGFDIIS